MMPLLRTLSCCLLMLAMLSACGVRRDLRLPPPELPPAPMEEQYDRG